MSQTEASVLATAGKAKVGVMVCGHKEYWPQFPGLKEELLLNSSVFTGYVQDSGVAQVISRFVDTVEDAYAFGVELKSRDVDLLLIFLTTYVASGRYIQGALRADCPVVLVGLQRPIDLSQEFTLQTMTGAGSPCQMPEACNAFIRCGRPAVDIIFGELYNDERVKRRIREWCSAANAKSAFKGSIFGYLGHSYEGMLDMNFDPTTVTCAFGAHVRMLEMCELVSNIENVSKPELDQKLRQIRETFDILEQSPDPTTKPVEEEDLVWAAKVSAGMDKLVFGNRLSGLAYYYMGENNSVYERAASNLTVGNSLLMADGVSMAGEGDMKTCLAMHLTSALGCGGSFAELCSVDFDADIVIVGHDGLHDIRIGNRRPQIRGLNLLHGKKGYGVSVEFSIRHGEMTMVGVGSDDTGTFRIVVAEGESQAGWVPPIGNTLTRAYLGPNVSGFIEDWCKAGTCHHMSLCVGHCGDMVDKFGKLAGIEVVRVR